MSRFPNEFAISFSVQGKKKQRTSTLPLMIVRVLFFLFLFFLLLFKFRRSSRIFCLFLMKWNLSQLFWVGGAVTTPDSFSQSRVATLM